MTQIFLEIDEIEDDLNTDKERVHIKIGVKDKAEAEELLISDINPYDIEDEKYDKKQEILEKKLPPTQFKSRVHYCNHDSGDPCTVEDL